jgi:hypothetical protein
MTLTGDPRQRYQLLLNAAFFKHSDPVLRNDIMTLYSTLQQLPFALPSTSHCFSSRGDNPASLVALRHSSLSGYPCSGQHSALSGDQQL